MEPPPEPPPSLMDVFDDLLDVASKIRKKNKIMIDYYIYPKATPNQIADYEPRVAILEDRLQLLKKLDFKKLQHLIDGPEWLGAHFVSEIIQQLINAVDGFVNIFVNHYNRDLENTRPYEILIGTLVWRSRQVTGIISAGRRTQAGQLRPVRPPYFCRGAVDMINKRDHGTVSVVDKSDYLEGNKIRLRQFGGSILWWKCPACDFKMRYHVNLAVTSSVSESMEVREFPGIPLQYRAVFLAKSHLFSPAARYVGKHRYGCLFCYGQGKELVQDVTSFTTGKDLARHICSKHRSTLAPPLLLEKFNVAVNDQKSKHVDVWDLNIQK